MEAWLGLVIVRTGMRLVGEVLRVRMRGGPKWQEPTCPAGVLCGWLQFVGAGQAPMVRAAANIAFMDVAMGAG